MIRRQFPPRPISGEFQAMHHSEMPAQGSRVKPTFETDDILGLHRSSDWHRRRQPLRRRCWRGRARTEPAQRLMYRRDHIADLIDGDTVFRGIAADNLGNQARIDAWDTVVIRHNLPSPFVAMGLTSKLNQPAVKKASLLFGFPFLTQRHLAPISTVGASADVQFSMSHRSSKARLLPVPRRSPKIR
jgi:hypothetical protein